MRRPPEAPSLRARALRCLARREHSRLELSRKLAPHAPTPDDLEQALDQLEREGLLSDQRFVDALVQRRAGRFGSRRIEQELHSHGIDRDDQAPVLQSLETSERIRAQAVRRKRFGDDAPADMAERGRQQRFLLQRGFSGATITWVLKRAGASDSDDEAA